MNLAFDIKHLSGSGDPVFRDYMIELLRHLTGKNPLQGFIILTDRNAAQPELGGNAVVVSSPPREKGLLQKYWLNVQLPSLLKKKSVSAYFSTDGTCSLAAKWPQFILLPDPAILKKQESNLLKYLQKADCIISFSGKLKEELVNIYKIPPAKIELLKAGVQPVFKPLSFEEKQRVKEEYTDGKEFFIYTGKISKDQVLVLLKAFSLFKKRQQSGIKLVLAAEIDNKDKSFSESLSAYKYRNDVVVTGPLTVAGKARLLASAYALVDPSLDPGTGIMAAQAAASGVPVIANAGQPLLEKDTFLEADTADQVDLAAQMMLMYKDEGLRQQLIHKSAIHATEYDLGRSADSLWKLIMKRLT